MRTRNELEILARRLERQTRSSSPESSGRAEAVPEESARRTEPLFTFPESTVALRGSAATEGPILHRMLRQIEVVPTRAGPEFRLIEEEFVSNPAGEVVRHYDPIDIATDTDAFGIVSAGFRRLDEDRLWERIEPVVARIATDGCTEAEYAAAVVAVERSTADLDLSAAARLRLKSDAIDLLDGRLELGDFVARTAARQECYAVAQRAELAQQHTESIEV